jgi:hypothetical protein
LDWVKLKSHLLTRLLALTKGCCHFISCWLRWTRKNAEEASKHQIAAVQKIQEAADLYEAAIRVADNHVLKPKGVAVNGGSSRNKHDGSDL